MKYERVIVRQPGSRYAECISSHPLRSTIDVEAARVQHLRYCETLRELGLEVIELPRDDDHPDSCFVEDTAVVHNGRAFICRPAKESRRGEETPVLEILSQYMQIGRAKDPATIEGGDIIHAETELISGLTQRTNAEGVSQMAQVLRVPVRTIADPSIVHLKSFANFLGNGQMLVTEKFSGAEPLRDYEQLIVPDEEWYASNVLVIDDTVLMPSGYPKTTALLDAEGYRTISLDMGEFPKCEGAFTCLSILF